MGFTLRCFAIGVIAASLASAGAGGETIFGRNLISNPGAEDGDVSLPQYTGSVVIIPGWTRVGKTDVVPYGRFMDLSHMAPVNHRNNYFVGGWSNASSTLLQDIDLSSGAATIDGGGVTFEAAAYLGDDFGKPDQAAMTVSFYDGSGRGLKTVSLGPVAGGGMMFQRRIGAVPKLARKVTVSLDFTRLAGADNDGAADDLSLILNMPALADSVLNRNLLVNPGAELGPPAASPHEIAIDIPGWTRTTPFNVERYAPGTTGPPNHGAALFTAGKDSEVSTGVQDVDVSAAAEQIDSGSIRYAASGWLNGGSGSTGMTVEFRDGNDSRLGTVGVGPAAAAGVVPAGTRQIRVAVTMTRANASSPNDGCADDLSLVLTSGAPSAAPTISSVRSAQGFGGFASIAPGTWIEIAGYGLSPVTREWTSGDFNGSLAPQSLDGVRVTIGGQNAVLSYISPGQVNALVPANVAPGSASLVVNNGASNLGPYQVNINPTMPGLLAPDSFRLGGQQHVVALLPDWKTYVLPSRPAKPGDEIILLGIGFGAVTASVPPGAVVGQVNRLTTPLEIRIGGVPAEVRYAGLAPGFIGLYQFNVIVPALADNDAALVTFDLGGTAGSQTLFLAVGR